MIAPFMNVMSAVQIIYGAYVLSVGLFVSAKMKINQIENNKKVIS